MRRRLKPIVVVVFFVLFGLLLVIGKAHSDGLRKQQLASAKASMFQVGNYQMKLIMTLYLKIFLVLLYVSMEGHKSVKIATLPIQLVSINRLRHILKNFKNEMFL